MQKQGIVALAWTVLATVAAILVAVGVARQRTEVHAQAVSVAGQSATRLADGRWLRTGGDAGTGPVSIAVIDDPVAQTTTTLASTLVEPRAWHTATLLANRQVLIAGGRGRDGVPLDTAELFDPDTETFMTIAGADPIARTEHTATLLTDGRVFIAGGVGTDGEQLTVAEIWDVAASTVVPVAGAAQKRSFHSATLRADGRVHLTGGTDANGQPVPGADMFTTATSTVGPWLAPVQDPDAPSTVAASSPADAAAGVSLDAFVTLRFSRVLDVESVNDRTVVLSGPHGAVPARVFAAEGRLVFVRPFDLLEPSAAYTVSVANLVDSVDLPVVTSPITFTTADAADVDGEFWVPDDTNFDHQWVSGRPPSPWQALAPLVAEPGTTAISGQVLALDGHPLANVTIEIDEAQARTDSTGRFVVRLPAGRAAHKEMLIDGRSANRGNRRYGVFEYGLDVRSGKTTVLPFTIWMPRLDTSHEVAIPSPTSTETVITTPYIPGLELHLPAGAIVRGEDGEVVTRIGITPIPIDRTPFPLATGVDVPVYFTVQPGGAYIETAGAGPKGGWLVYPNYRRDRPRQRLQFFHYDPEDKGWYVYGLGTVASDGQHIVPDASTRVYELTGAMINDGSSPPNSGATPGGPTVADPIDPSTGVFVMRKTDLALPDVIPIALTRVYNSGDEFVRPFGTGMSHPYAMFLWSAQQYQEADLVLPEGGKIHFDRTTEGTGYSDAQFVHHETEALNATPTPFYGAVMSWTGNGWNIRLTDGTVYEFGVNAPLQSITDRYGNVVRISHESGRYGNVTQVTSPNGRWIAFRYEAGKIVEARDNLGRSITYAYDSNQNLASVTDAEGGVTTYTYTAANQLATITDARGIAFVTNRYGQDGRVAEQTLADPAARYQFAYTQAASGGIAQTEITDPRGIVERVTFNADHYLLEDVEGVGTSDQRTTTFERQPRTNFVTAMVDGLGRRTTYAYAALPDVRAITQLAGTPDAATTTFEYEPTFHQLRSVADPLNHVWTTQYDGSGHIVTTIDPQQVSTAFATDNAGRVISVTNPLQQTWRINHAGGDRLSIENPAGAVWGQFVDDAGRALSASDPLGRVTRTGFDKLDRVTSIVDAAGGEIRFAYDANGRITSLFDPLNHSTTFDWDASNRLAARTDALQHAEHYAYDALDNVVSATDRNGQVTTYEYDSLYRLALVTYADGSTTRYVFDAGDRLVRIVDSIGGTIEREYDGLDHLTSETTAEGTVTYAYDADGRRTSMTVAGQTPVTYEYDSAHRVTTIGQGGSVVAMTYDEAGRRSSLRLPNAMLATYGYDAAGYVASITYTKGPTVVGDLTYVYDSAGNRTSVGGSLATSALPADVSTAQYDDANRLTSWNGQSLVYDDNGNLITDGAATYTWNARSQLSAIGGASPAAFEYDGVGRRRGRSGQAQTRFLYDGVNVVQERAGAAPSANLLTGGLDEVFQRVDGTGAHSLLADALGSTVALADEIGGVSTRYAYDPFGATTVTGEPSTNTSQFTGREVESNGLYFSRARYYDPRRGRFLSEDPIGSAGGPNLYSYAHNMPTRVTDPFGLYDRDVHYDLTRGTGVQVGMCAGDAEAIARADQNVDDNWSTDPLPPWNVGAREKYHFTSAEQRAWLRREAFSSGSRTWMGIYLHAFQDSFSHQHGRKDRGGEPYGHVIGHLLDWTGPDLPRHRPELWRRMFQKTQAELWDFHQKFPTCRGW